jgi:hypothetical protein
VIAMASACSENKKPDSHGYQVIKSEPAGIQTPTLLIRSQMLYSVKLQAR